MNSCSKRSASWGRFQIMGENHASAGYATIEWFARDLCASQKK
ncbi:N-acetylmuramidase family protein [Luteimonas yindakuii]|nr:N-acetylmuramidase family protein [Luteimonas yindakuii]